mmetsp:Transcript_36520/g.66578  ORF Transcript_36520/g.66578 Transcript_36520/m.66578 type:complete len:211 (-) Transcript_36520:134-766(-)
MLFSSRSFSRAGSTLRTCTSSPGGRSCQPCSFPLGFLALSMSKSQKRWTSASSLSASSLLNSWYVKRGFPVLEGCLRTSSIALLQYSEVNSSHLLSSGITLHFCRHSSKLNSCLLSGWTRTSSRWWRTCLPGSRECSSTGSTKLKPLVMEYLITCVQYLMWCHFRKYARSMMLYLRRSHGNSRRWIWKTRLTVLFWRASFLISWNCRNTS